MIMKNLVNGYGFIGKEIKCSFLPYKRGDMKQMYRVRTYDKELPFLLNKLSYRPPFISTKMQRLLNIVDSKG